MKYALEDVDVLVIGSGAIGATYARCLAGAGRQVTMIDAGPQLRRRPGHHLLNTFVYQNEPNLSLDEMMANHNVFSTAQRYDPALLPKGAYAPKLARLNFENPKQRPDENMPFAGTMYAVGGMFAFWSGFAPIPTEQERTKLIGARDWERMIAIGVKLLNVHTDAFEPSAVTRALRTALSTPDRPMGNMPMGAQKRNLAGHLPGHEAYFVDWTGSDTIMGPLVEPSGRLASNLRILELHRAEELVWRRPGGHSISAVLVRDLTNLELKKFRAAQVVVAGGSFPSTTLLWNSRIRPPALGRYLCDNPVATGKVLLGTEFVERLRADRDNPARDEPVPISWSDAPPRCGFMPTSDNPWLIHVTRTGRGMAYDLQYDARLDVDITAYSSIAPDPANRIEFSDSMKDRFGMPQITIHYRLSDADKAVQQRMLADVNELGARIGVFYKMARPPFTMGASLQPPGTSLHLTGVTRMGKTDADSVVDANGKVWGFDNLYVGGAGVLSEAIASNPTLTCCAIATKSAAAILGCTLEELERRVCPDSQYRDPGMPLRTS